jgi:hypothetical protein
MKPDEIAFELLKMAKSKEEKKRIENVIKSLAREERFRKI